MIRDPRRGGPRAFDRRKERRHHQDGNAIYEDVNDIDVETCHKLKNPARSAPPLLIPRSRSPSPGDHRKHASSSKHQRRDRTRRDQSPDWRDEDERATSPTSPTSPSSPSSDGSASSDGFALLDISRRSHKERGITGFISGLFNPSSPPEGKRPRRKTSFRRKKKKRGILFFTNNSSSSSLGSDMAYGDGYLVQRKEKSRWRRGDGRGGSASRDRPESSGRSKAARPRTDDEEIVKIGRQLSDLVHRQSRKPKGRRRGLIGTKRVEHDDPDWESASEDEDDTSSSNIGTIIGTSGDESGSDLAYGPASITPPSKGPTATSSPQRFGSDLAYGGLVGDSPKAAPKQCRDDRNTVGRKGPGLDMTSDVYHDQRKPDDRPLELRTPPSASLEKVPMQAVFPVPTSDPTRFDAERAVAISSSRETRHRNDRPAPAPLQQPIPVSPVPSRMYETDGIIDLEQREQRNYSRHKREGSGFSNVISAAGLALMSGARKDGDLHRDESSGRDDSGREGRPRYHHRQEQEQSEHSRRHGNVPRGVKDHSPRRNRRDEHSSDESALPPSSGTANSYRHPANEILQARSSFEPCSPPRNENIREASTIAWSQRLDDGRELQTDDRDIDVRRTRQGYVDIEPITTDRHPGTANNSFSPKLQDAAPSASHRAQDRTFSPAPDGHTSAETAESTSAPLIVTIAPKFDDDEYDISDSHDHPYDYNRHDVPDRRLSRLDSYELERGRARQRGTSCIRSQAPEPRIDFPTLRRRGSVQEEADRHYRLNRRASRAAAEEMRSRSNSPDSSIVDKYEYRDNYGRRFTIVNPPEAEKPKEDSPYDGPDADVQINNFITPQALNEFLGPWGAQRPRPAFYARDPSCQRDRPLINVVYPTPQPTPSPEKQVEKVQPPREDNQWTGPGSREVAAKEKDDKRTLKESDHEPLARETKDAGKLAMIAAAVVGGTIAAVMSRRDDDCEDDWVDQDDKDASPTFRNPFEVALGRSAPERYEEPVPPSAFQMPRTQASHHGGGFEDDIEFPAVLAAGLEASGLDPNIVLDDPKYSSRESPRGSNSPTPSLYQRPTVEAVDDNGDYPDRPKSTPLPPDAGTILEFSGYDPVQGDAIGDSTEDFVETARKNPRRRSAHPESLQPLAQADRTRTMRESATTGPTSHDLGVVVEPDESSEPRVSKSSGGHTPASRLPQSVTAQGAKLQRTVTGDWELYGASSQLDTEVFEINPRSDIPEKERHAVSNQAAAPSSHTSTGQPEKDMDRRSGASSLFGFLRNRSDSKDKDNDGGKSRKELEVRGKENSRQSFFGEAGILGAGVGLVSASAALAANLVSSHPHSKATDDSSSSELTPPLHDAPDRDTPDHEFADPDIVPRAIKPAIDPPYGDLLPLPPSEPASPASRPVPDEGFNAEELLPVLPDSRPETPPHERQIGDTANIRRRPAAATSTPRISCSPTAVPIQLRLGSRPGRRSNPSTPHRSRGSSAASPEGLVTGSVRPRISSWDGSKEMRPLWLLHQSTQSPPSPRQSQEDQGHGQEHASHERDPNKALDLSLSLNDSFGDTLMSGSDKLEANDNDNRYESTKAPVMAMSSDGSRSASPTTIEESLDQPKSGKDYRVDSVPSAPPQEPSTIVPQPIDPPREHLGDVADLPLSGNWTWGGESKHEDRGPLSQMQVWLTERAMCASEKTTDEAKAPASLAGDDPVRQKERTAHDPLREVENEFGVTAHAAEPVLNEDSTAPPSDIPTNQSEHNPLATRQVLDPPFEDSPAPERNSEVSTSHIPHLPPYTAAVTGHNEPAPNSSLALASILPSRAVFDDEVNLASVMRRAEDELSGDHAPPEEFTLSSQKPCADHLVHETRQSHLPSALSYELIFNQSAQNWPADEPSREMHAERMPPPDIPDEDNSLEHDLDRGNHEPESRNADNENDMAKNDTQLEPNGDEKEKDDNHETLFNDLRSVEPPPCEPWTHADCDLAPGPVNYPPDAVNNDIRPEFGLEVAHRTSFTRTLDNHQYDIVKTHPSDSATPDLNPDRNSCYGPILRSELNPAEYPEPIQVSDPLNDDPHSVPHLKRLFENADQLAEPDTLALTSFAPEIDPQSSSTSTDAIPAALAAFDPEAFVEHQTQEPIDRERGAGTDVIVEETIASESSPLAEHHILETPEPSSYAAGGIRQIDIDDEQNPDEQETVPEFVSDSLLESANCYYPLEEAHSAKEQPNAEQQSQGAEELPGDHAPPSSLSDTQPTADQYDGKSEQIASHEDFSDVNEPLHDRIEFRQEDKTPPLDIISESLQEQGASISQPVTKKIHHKIAFPFSPEPISPNSEDHVGQGQLPELVELPSSPEPPITTDNGLEEPDQTTYSTSFQGPFAYKLHYTEDSTMALKQDHDDAATVANELTSAHLASSVQAIAIAGEPVTSVSREVVVGLASSDTLPHHQLLNDIVDNAETPENLTKAEESDPPIDSSEKTTAEAVVSQSINAPTPDTHTSELTRSDRTLEAEEKDSYLETLQANTARSMGDSEDDNAVEDGYVSCSEAQIPDETRQPVGHGGHESAEVDEPQNEHGQITEEQKNKHLPEQLLPDLIGPLTSEILNASLQLGPYDDPPNNENLHTPGEAPPDLEEHAENLELQECQTRQFTRDNEVAIAPELSGEVVVERTPDASSGNTPIGEESRDHQEAFDMLAGRHPDLEVLQNQVESSEAHEIGGLIPHVRGENIAESIPIVSERAPISSGENQSSHNEEEDPTDSKPQQKDDESGNIEDGCNIPGAIDDHVVPSENAQPASEETYPLQEPLREYPEEPPADLGLSHEANGDIIEAFEGAAEITPDATPVASDLDPPKHILPKHILDNILHQATVPDSHDIIADVSESTTDGAGKKSSEITEITPSSENPELATANDVAEACPEMHGDETSHAQPATGVQEASEVNETCVDASAGTQEIVNVTHLDHIIVSEEPFSTSASKFYEQVTFEEQSVFKKANINNISGIHEEPSGTVGTQTEAVVKEMPMSEEIADIDTSGVPQRDLSLAIHESQEEPAAEKTPSMRGAASDTASVDFEALEEFALGETQGDRGTFIDNATDLRQDSLLQRPPNTSEEPIFDAALEAQRASAALVESCFQRTQEVQDEPAIGVALELLDKNADDNLEDRLKTTTDPETSRVHEGSIIEASVSMEEEPVVNPPHAYQNTLADDIQENIGLAAGSEKGAGNQILIPHDEIAKTENDLEPLTEASMKKKSETEVSSTASPSNSLGNISHEAALRDSAQAVEVSRKPDGVQVGAAVDIPEIASESTTQYTGGENIFGADYQSEEPVIRPVEQIDMMTVIEDNMEEAAVAVPEIASESTTQETSGENAFGGDYVNQEPAQETSGENAFEGDYENQEPAIAEPLEPSDMTVIEDNVKEAAVAVPAIASELTTQESSEENIFGADYENQEPAIAEPLETGDITVLEGNVKDFKSLDVDESSDIQHDAIIDDTVESRANTIIQDDPSIMFAPREGRIKTDRADASADKSKSMATLDEFPNPETPTGADERVLDHPESSDTTIRKIYLAEQILEAPYTPAFQMATGDLSSMSGGPGTISEEVVLPSLSDDQPRVDHGVVISDQAVAIIATTQEHHEASPETVNEPALSQEQRSKDHSDGSLESPSEATRSAQADLKASLEQTTESDVPSERTPQDKYNAVLRELSESFGSDSMHDPISRRHDADHLNPLSFLAHFNRSNSTLLPQSVMTDHVQGLEPIEAPESAETMVTELLDFEGNIEAPEQHLVFEDLDSAKHVITNEDENIIRPPDTKDLALSKEAQTSSITAESQGHRFVASSPVISRPVSPVVLHTQNVIGAEDPLDAEPIQDIHASAAFCEDMPEDEVSQESVGTSQQHALEYPPIYINEAPSRKEHGLPGEAFISPDTVEESSIPQALDKPADISTEQLFNTREDDVPVMPATAEEETPALSSDTSVEAYDGNQQRGVVNMDEPTSGDEPTLAMEIPLLTDPVWSWESARFQEPGDIEESANTDQPASPRDISNTIRQSISSVDDEDSSHDLEPTVSSAAVTSRLRGSRDRAPGFWGVMGGLWGRSRGSSSEKPDRPDTAMTDMSPDSPMPSFDRVGSRHSTDRTSEPATPRTTSTNQESLDMVDDEPGVPAVLRRESVLAHDLAAVERSLKSRFGLPMRRGSLMMNRGGSAVPSHSRPATSPAIPMIHQGTQLESSTIREEEESRDDGIAPKEDGRLLASKPESLEQHAGRVEQLLQTPQPIKTPILEQADVQDVSESPLELSDNLIEAIQSQPEPALTDVVHEAEDDVELPGRSADASPIHEVSSSFGPSTESETTGSEQHQFPANKTAASDAAQTSPVHDGPDDARSHVGTEPTSEQIALDTTITDPSPFEMHDKDGLVPYTPTPVTDKDEASALIPEPAFEAVRLVQGTEAPERPSKPEGSLIPSSTGQYVWNQDSEETLFQQPLHEPDSRPGSEMGDSSLSEEFVLAPEYAVEDSSTETPRDRGSFDGSTFASFASPASPASEHRELVAPEETSVVELPLPDEQIPGTINPEEATLPKEELQPEPAANYKQLLPDQSPGDTFVSEAPTLFDESSYDMHTGAANKPDQKPVDHTPMNQEILGEANPEKENLSHLQTSAAIETTLSADAHPAVESEFGLLSPPAEKLQQVGQEYREAALQVTGEIEAVEETEHPEPSDTLPADRAFDAIATSTSTQQVGRQSQNALFEEQEEPSTPAKKSKKKKKTKTVSVETFMTGREQGNEEPHDGAAGKETREEENEDVDDAATVATAMSEETEPATPKKKLKKKKKKKKGKMDVEGRKGDGGSDDDGDGNGFGGSADATDEAQPGSEYLHKRDDGSRADGKADGRVEQEPGNGEPGEHDGEERPTEDASRNLQHQKHQDGARLPALSPTNMLVAPETWVDGDIDGFELVGPRKKKKRPKAEVCSETDLLQSVDVDMNQAAETQVRDDAEVPETDWLLDDAGLTSTPPRAANSKPLEPDNRPEKAISGAVFLEPSSQESLGSLTPSPSPVRIDGRQFSNSWPFMASPQEQTASEIQTGEHIRRLECPQTPPRTTPMSSDDTTPRPQRSSMTTDDTTQDQSPCLKRSIAKTTSSSPTRSSIPRLNKSPMFIAGALGDSSQALGDPTAATAQALSGRVARLNGVLGGEVVKGRRRRAGSESGPSGHEFTDGGRGKPSEGYGQPRSPLNHFQRPDAADLDQQFLRRRTSNLAPVAEETHDQLGEGANTIYIPKRGRLLQTPDPNDRDSGIESGSPRQKQQEQRSGPFMTKIWHQQQQQQQQQKQKRDSGVHIRELGHDVSPQHSPTYALPSATNSMDSLQSLQSIMSIQSIPFPVNGAWRLRPRRSITDHGDAVPDRRRLRSTFNMRSVSDDAGVLRGIDTVMGVGVGDRGRTTPTVSVLGDSPRSVSLSSTSLSLMGAPQTPQLQLQPPPRDLAPPQTFTPEPGSASPPLRRTDAWKTSRDLRSLGLRNSADETGSSNTPIANEGRVRAKDMTDVYDGYGEGRIGSPISPTRPHSLRRRHSMQVLELQAKVEQLLSENQRLAELRAQSELNTKRRAEEVISDQKSRHDAMLADRDSQIETLRRTVQSLKEEVGRLAEVNDGLNSATSQLAVQHNTVRQLELHQNTSSREIEDAHIAREQYLRELRSKDAEIEHLRAELEVTKKRIRDLQKQIQATIPASSHDFLSLHDEDHFDNRCRQLSSHVRQWVLRFSKFSDMRASRLTREINDEKTVDRLDNAVLDGSDVDMYLGDRVRRRDVFMSMTMSMIWEFIFTRYLFGMDREQRQKIKNLEKQLAESNPALAVRQWRAKTLTLWTARPLFAQQCELDTEAVVQAIFQTLSRILPPPSNREEQIQAQLRRVIREAVSLSIEMRTQIAEYMMLPPLQPEYNDDGELVETFPFSTAMMNEASGDMSISDSELQAQGAIVRIVLFPVVIKKGNDAGVGDEDVVICPAEVLVARDKIRPVSRTAISPSSFGIGSSPAPLTPNAAKPPVEGEQRCMDGVI